MNPILKTALIVFGLLIVGIVAAFLYEFLTWPKAKDEPTNKTDYDET